MGGPVIDPTKNVLDLTNAANKRQDDLREMHNRFLEAEFGRLEETVKRVEQVSDLRAEHAREVNQIHQRHDREIHKMEQDKLAAFRASDEMARITEANRSLAAIQVVERTLNSTATALASQNAENNVEVNRRLAALEKSSYEGAGKQAVADPALAEIISEFKALRLSVVGQQSQGSGQSEGVDKTIKYIVIALAALVSLMTLGGMIIGIAFAIKSR
jgi:hypothetical protein